MNKQKVTELIPIERSLCICSKCSQKFILIAVFDIGEDLPLEDEKVGQFYEGDNLNFLEMAGFYYCPFCGHKQMSNIMDIRESRNEKI